jgi:hypothetical protein
MLRSTLCKQPTPLEIRLRPHHFLPEDRLDDLTYTLRACRELSESLVEFRVLEVLSNSTNELVGKGVVSRLRFLRMGGMRVSQRGNVLEASTLSNGSITHLFPLSVRHD